MRTGRPSAWVVTLPGATLTFSLACSAPPILPLAVASPSMLVVRLAPAGKNRLNRSGLSLLNCARPLKSPDCRHWPCRHNRDGALLKQAVSKLASLAEARSAAGCSSVQFPTGVSLALNWVTRPCQSIAGCCNPPASASWKLPGSPLSCAVSSCAAGVPAPSSRKFFQCWPPKLSPCPVTFNRERLAPPTSRLRSPRNCWTRVSPWRRSRTVKLAATAGWSREPVNLPLLATVPLTPGTSDLSCGTSSVHAKSQRSASAPLASSRASSAFTRKALTVRFWPCTLRSAAPDTRCPLRVPFSCSNSRFARKALFSIPPSVLS